jgi:hypothetical protein
VRVESDDGASCSASVSTGECTLSPSMPGVRTLTATYAGAAEFEGSTDTAPHTVATPEPIRTTTHITADDPDPSDVGQPVTVQFTVTASSGAPAGTVTITASGGSETCSASVAAGACALTLTAEGDRTLTASYAGGGGFGPSTGTEGHLVRAPALPPSATASSITVKDASIEVNHDTDVKVVVRDANGVKLKGVAVTLSATGDGVSITPTSATTGKEGDATFKFRSSLPGTSSITAVAAGVVLADHPTITVR